RGRIEDDAVVFGAPADFALREGERVVENPADFVLADSGRARVFMRPVERLLRGVHVGYLRAAKSRRERSAAGVCKKIQHFGLRELLAALAHPAPVRRLLGENAGMFEAREARVERELPGRHEPGLGKRLARFPRAFRVAAAKRKHGVSRIPKLGFLLFPE